ncbi:MAG TPA: ABC transporter ATP-binding protein [Thermoanaerobaculia bacterium]|jgi:putrescine transport system ATP-binding protein|nr:ABC transporter ATP-binding protein [Thermoanaerobaculia bacterium]
MFLEVQALTKSFGRRPVLSGIDLAVPREKTFAILGRSGCGKTTLLKILAGLLSQDGGAIRLGGEEITALPPERRRALYLYQEPLLFPHLDAFENVAFGLRLRGTSEPEVRRKVEAMLGELELPSEGRKMPHQLSGGERQRISFGRALIVEPALLLLDEPFSSLDGETRTAMQQLYQRIAAAHSITALFVTHSLKEALLMGDSIGLMREGRLVAYPSKEDFLRDPESGVGAEIAFWTTLQGSTV